MSNINVMRKNLGPVTAYKYAVQQGYTGTEQEFAALMASYATVAEEAEAAKDDAIDAKTAAEEAQAAAEAAAQTLVIDNTLTNAGQAADAKVVGDNLANVNDFEKTTFKNPIIFSRLTSYSMWAFGQRIIEDTGANRDDNKACRTTYVEFTEPILLLLDNADYEYIVWVYSSKSISDALYSPIKAYKNKPLIILPKASTSYFRISVKRADGAVLTTDYSDTSSDAYKIITATKTYTMNGRMCVNKMACFGDSIMWGRDGNGSGSTQTPYTIPIAIAKRLNCVCDNYGVGGQGFIQSDGTPNAYDNISGVDLTAYTVMVMCYGVNDGFNTVGEWDSTDESTIMGQFNKIVNYVYTQNPNIRLIVFAPWPGRNVGSFPDYWYGDVTVVSTGRTSRKILSDAMKRACDYYWIPYIEQYDSPINPLNIGTALPDGVHPSNEFYKLIGDWVAAKVSGLL